VDADADAGLADDEDEDEDAAGRKLCDCGFCFEDEAVERDIFILYWLSKYVRVYIILHIILYHIQFYIIIIIE
jgi:hypothetical protein